jgi:hypothetical protein
MKHGIVMTNNQHKKKFNDKNEKDHNIIDADNDNNENDDEIFHFLTFGGPSTWGIGIDDMRKEAAYPYLLSSSSSSSYVRNVVQSQYENGGSGPTFASLCTQSIVEEQDDDDDNDNDNNKNNNNKYKYKYKSKSKKAKTTRSSTLIGNGHDNNANDDLSNNSNSNIVYDVITLEYYEYETTTLTITKDADTNDANANVFSPSMQLLAKRLRQRYPFATIIYIKLWTPLDLIYYDPLSNRTISFIEWRRRYQHQQKQKLQQQQQQTLIEAMKEHTWTFRRDLSSSNDNDEQQQKRQQEDDDLQITMDTVDGIIYEMSRPYDINDSLEIIEDWFFGDEKENENEDEETIDSDGDDDDNNKFLRYTLSREGHAIIAKDLRVILNDPTVIRKRKNKYYPSSSSSSPTLSTSVTSSSSSQQQLLGSWGSGDSCQIWYDTGKNSLPDHHFEYSKGLKLIEFHPNLYALEVQGGGGDATLRVYNPFDEDRMVYISYMTTSAIAAANKVYPKIKVRIQQQQQEKKPVKEGSSSKMRLLASSSLLSSSSNSIILDPSHDDNNDDKHRMRTTAIGFVSAHSTGILDFSPLEEYTVHNFRLVGVSFLAVQENKNKMMTHNNNVPSEFAISPRRLSVKSATRVDDIDDDDETTKTNK